MQFYIIFVFLIYLQLPIYNAISFNLTGDGYLSSFSYKEKVGEVLIYTYRPNKQIKTITFSRDHTLELPQSDKIVRLKVITKQDEIKLVHITYADLSNNNDLYDVYYHRINNEFHKIEKDLFYINLVKLSNNYKTFNLNSLRGDWFTCSEGLTEQKLCSVSDYYFIKNIVIGNKTLWENTSHYNVHSIEVGYRETEANNLVKLKIYCYTSDGTDIVNVECPINEQDAISFKTVVQRRESKSSKSPSNSTENLRVTHVIDKKRLKNIELYFEGDRSSSKKYKTRSNILLGLDNTYYEPIPGNEIKCIKDGNAIIWHPSENCKNFVHARFTYTGLSPILLNVKYMVQKKNCVGYTKLLEKNEFFIKECGWRTLSEAQFTAKIAILSDEVTKKKIYPGISYDYVLPTEEPETKTQESDKDQNRLKNIKLELDPPDPNGYNHCRYLMDGLDTFFYDPKEGKIVKSVMDGDNRIWTSDDNKRKLKHAKFAYKKDSHIFLSVLYSQTESSKFGSDKEVNHNDYFVKRDQWYHSPENQFYEELDKLKNKVTMKDVILNEQKTFEEHISDLTFKGLTPKKTWIQRILRKKVEPKKFTPFEYNIANDKHEHLLVDVNTKEKFGVYTPNNGYALTRLFDQDRLIWYQETDGLGCTTFYMDLSGENPLLHLMLDDPINSNIYYKKQDNNWHIIDKQEYERIRKPAEGQTSPNEFHHIS